MLVAVRLEIQANVFIKKTHHHVFGLEQALRKMKQNNKIDTQ